MHKPRAFIDDPLQEHLGDLQLKHPNAEFILRIQGPRLSNHLKVQQNGRLDRLVNQSLLAPKQQHCDGVGGADYDRKYGEG